MKRFPTGHFFLFIALLVFIVAIASKASACSEYIAYEEGNVPILLTSPHGAGKRALLPGVPSRKGSDVKHFVTRVDQYTDQLTWRVVELLKQKGLIPFVVVAGVHRSQIDFNRRPEEAYEVKQAEGCYRYYHQQINRSVKVIKQKWTYGFMLDVHGQSKYTYDLLRGTRNKQSIQDLVTRFAKDVTESDEGFFEILRSKGYSLSPQKNQKEEYYSGGFTLSQYGSHQPTGIDSMQVEISRAIRINDVRKEKVANDIADAISRFYKRYYRSDINNRN